MFREPDGVEAVLEFLSVGWKVKEPLVHLLLVTGPLQRQHRPAFTCSLASTVLHDVHQLTGENSRPLGRFP